MIFSEFSKAVLHTQEKRGWVRVFPLPYTEKKGICGGRWVGGRLVFHLPTFLPGSFLGE